jgi:hypothetical protein
MRKGSRLCPSCWRQQEGTRSVRKRPSSKRGMRRASAGHERKNLGFSQPQKKRVLSNHKKNLGFFELLSTALFPQISNRAAEGDVTRKAVRSQGRVRRGAACVLNWAGGWRCGRVGAPAARGVASRPCCAQERRNGTQRTPHAGRQGRELASRRQARAAANETEGGVDAGCRAAAAARIPAGGRARRTRAGDPDVRR